VVLWYFHVMAKHTLRNKLAREGMTARTLSSTDGEGYVLHVIDPAHKPPQVHTAVRQPGQDRTLITTNAVRLEQHPDCPDLPLRYRGAEPIEPISPDALATMLDGHSPNPVAQLAVAHLLEQ
jgi:hypothetical protein